MIQTLPSVHQQLITSSSTVSSLQQQQQQQQVASSVVHEIRHSRNWEQSVAVPPDVSIVRTVPDPTRKDLILISI